LLHGQVPVPAWVVLIAVVLGTGGRSRRAALAQSPHNVKPFAIAVGSQFRPGPPISLDSNEWATDY
jgi:hypothetical protein